MLKRITAILVVGGVLVTVFAVVGVARAERPSYRDPMLYGLASFAIPGLGQYLNGDTNKALTHFIVGVAIPVVGYYAGFISPFPLLVWAVTGLARFGWSVYSGLDAYNVAKEFNEEHGLKP